MKEKFCKSHISDKELPISIYKKFKNKNSTQFKNQQNIGQNISPKETTRDMKIRTPTRFHFIPTIIVIIIKK